MNWDTKIYSPIQKVPRPVQVVIFWNKIEKRWAVGFRVEERAGLKLKDAEWIEQNDHRGVIYDRDVGAWFGTPLVYFD